MRCGSEDDFRKEAVSVNAFFRKMKGREERSGLEGIRQINRAKYSACTVGSITREQEIMV